MVASARVAPMEDEELLETVQRAITESFLPFMERSGAEEFLILQARYCLNVLGSVRSGLKERQAARAEADREVERLYASRPADSGWDSPSALDTGRFLAQARERGDLDQPDSLAAAVRRVFVQRLRAEVDTRIGR